MTTHFDGMSHEHIYEVVRAGTPATVSTAAAQLTDLSTTISGHLDALDQLSASMTDAWPDQNGQNFRATLAHTVGYLRDLQATHVVVASSSITQVMSASHEKLASTLATMPPPPAVPVADQEASLAKQVTANHDAMNTGMAAESQRIAAAKADDAKAVALAKSLANTYLVEKAKLTAPPAAPKGRTGTGTGSSAPVGTSTSSSSSQAMSGYHSATSDGAASAGFVAGGSAVGLDGTAGGHPASFTPVHGGGTAVLGAGLGHGSGASVVGNPGVAGGHLGAGGPGSALVDPSANGAALYDAHGNLVGATAFDPASAGNFSAPSSTGAGGASAVGGVLGGGSGFGADGALGVTAVGGGLAAAGIVAARRAAAQRASEQTALLKAELSEEELAAGGGGGGGLSPSQLAAINAQRNGILTAAGERSGLLSSDRAMLAAQQRTSFGANAVLTAEEEAQLTAGQRMVPGQLGGTPATGSAAPRTGMPFAGAGVVGGAERVTWLVEDRDLFSADPGVRAVVDD